MELPEFCLSEYYLIIRIYFWVSKVSKEKNPSYISAFILLFKIVLFLLSVMFFHKLGDYYPPYLLLHIIDYLIWFYYCI